MRATLPITRRVASGEGPAIAVSHWRDSGQPVLFVHGFSHNRHIWDDLAAALNGDFRPFAVDLRGHGDSGWSLSGRYGVPDYASDLSRVLDDLGIERVRLVGHSLGGNAATLFAAQHPERVERLVLVDTGPSLSLGAMAFVAKDVAGAFQRYASIAEYRELLGVTYPLGDPTALDRMAETGLVERIDHRFEPRLDSGILAQSADPADWSALEGELWSALRSLRCPTLVVRGGVSAMLNEKVAREMVDETLRAGQLAIVPNAGHAVMVDNGPGLLAAVEAFLRESC